MAHGRRSDNSNYRRWPTSRLTSIGLLLKQTASDWFRDDALRLSAAVSFYAVLSLAPLLAIVIRVMGMVHASLFAREQLLKQTTNLMGPQVANAIKPIIENNATQSASYVATTISTVVLLFSATSVFIELRNSMNSIWGVKLNARERNPAEQAILTFIRARLLSLAMVFGLGLLLVISMFISGTLTAFQQYIVHVDQWPAYFARMAISFAVESILFGVIFKWLPNVQLRWKNVWLGALIAAILFSVGRFGLAIYFKYARITNVYGAAGSLLAVLTWIYYSCFSLFFGAEFTKVWTRQYDPRHASPNHQAAR